MAVLRNNAASRALLVTLPGTRRSSRVGQFLCWCALVIAWWLPESLPACAIPVFRYALERWEPDLYQAVVVHSGELSAADEQTLRELQRQSWHQGGPWNVEWSRRDLRTPAASPRDEIPLPATATLPWIVVRSATREGSPATRWQGSLANAAEFASLFDSPARQELARRIFGGDAVVWLVIAPEVEAGKQARESLQPRLQEAASQLTLPQGIGLPGSELQAGIPLEIRFSVQVVAAHDPAERNWLRMLASQSAKWDDKKSMIVPVFGRGRALEVLRFDDLDQSLIEELSGFLCGACSCQVKQANPGFDLPLAVSWEERLFGTPRSSGPEADAGVIAEPDSSLEAGGNSSPPELVAIAPGRGEVRLAATEVASVTSSRSPSVEPTRPAVETTSRAAPPAVRLPKLWKTWGGIGVCGMVAAIGLVGILLRARSRERESGSPVVTGAVDSRQDSAE